MNELLLFILLTVVFFFKAKYDILYDQMNLTTVSLRTFSLFTVKRSSKMSQNNFIDHLYMFLFQLV